MDIARALEYIHQERVVHADVRSVRLSRPLRHVQLTLPSCTQGNVFINSSLHAQLAHFNVSFFIDELPPTSPSRNIRNRNTSTATDNFSTADLALGVGDAEMPLRQYGSEYVQWMAPELLNGETQPTFETDVYAFGCLCVEVSVQLSLLPLLLTQSFSKPLTQLNLNLSLSLGRCSQAPRSSSPSTGTSSRVSSPRTRSPHGLQGVMIVSRCRMLCGRLFRSVGGSLGRGLRCGRL